MRQEYEALDIPTKQWRKMALEDRQTLARLLEEWPHDVMVTPFVDLQGRQAWMVAGLAPGGVAWFREGPDAPDR